MFDPTELPLPVVEVERERLVGADDGGGGSGDGTPVEEHVLDVDRVGEEEGGGLGPGDVDGPAVAPVEELVAGVAVAEVGVLQVGALLVADAEDLALVLVDAGGLVLLRRLSPARTEALRAPAI